MFDQPADMLSLEPVIPLRTHATWFFAAAVIVGLAIAVQVHYGINPDASWLLDEAERTLDGAVPYRDILETNPPASFLIYLPAVLLGRALGFSRECAAEALMFMGIALSLGLTGHVFNHSRMITRHQAPALLFYSIVTFVLMPMGSFAQREHIAVLAILPILATLCARASERKPDLVASTLAGIGAGVAMAIKPVFIMALVGPLACSLAGPSRRNAAAWPELWLTAALSLAYAGCVAVVFPDYFRNMLPLVEKVYLPARLDFASLLFLPLMAVWYLMLFLFKKIGGWSNPLSRLLMLSSAGFTFSVVVQGKGFTYHGYPSLALGGLACAVSVMKDPPAVNRAAVMAAAMLAGIAVMTELRERKVETPGLASTVAALSPHPRLLTIGNDQLYTVAFARSVGGTWVGSTSTTWVTNFATVIEPDAERSPRFVEEITAEKDLFAADIVRNRPDAILIEGDEWWKWALRGPRLARALESYTDAKRFGRFILLTRAEDVT